MYLLRLMLVGVWLGLLWVLFYFFEFKVASSEQSQFSPQHQDFSTTSFSSIQYVTSMTPIPALFSDDSSFQLAIATRTKSQHDGRKGAPSRPSQPDPLPILHAPTRL